MPSFERYFDDNAQVYVNAASDSGDIWEEYYDDDGQLYFYERSSGASAWVLPGSMEADAEQATFHETQSPHDLDAGYLDAPHDQDEADEAAYYSTFPQGQAEYDGYPQDETHAYYHDYVQEYAGHEGVHDTNDQDDQNVWNDQEGDPNIWNAYEGGQDGWDGQQDYYVGADYNYAATDDPIYTYEATDDPSSPYSGLASFDSAQPVEWIEYYDEAAQLPYFIHLSSGESVWELPAGASSMPGFESAWGQATVEPTNTQSDEVPDVQRSLEIVPDELHQQFNEAEVDTERLGPVAADDPPSAQSLDNVQSPENTQELEAFAGRETVEPELLADGTNAPAFLGLDSEITATGEITPADGNQIATIDLEAASAPRATLATEPHSALMPEPSDAGPLHSERAEVAGIVKSDDSKRQTMKTGLATSSPDSSKRADPKDVLSEGPTGDCPQSDADGPEVPQHLAAGGTHRAATEILSTDEPTDPPMRLVPAAADENLCTRSDARSDARPDARSDFDQGDDRPEANVLETMEYVVEREVPETSDDNETIDRVRDGREEPDVAGHPEPGRRKQTVLQRRRTRLREVQELAASRAFAIHRDSAGTRRDTVAIRMAPAVRNAVGELFGEFAPLSFRRMLRLMAQDATFRAKLAAASGGWRVKPSRVRLDFREADQNKDGELSQSELARFCQLAARRARGNRKHLRSYEARVAQARAKGAKKSSLESLKIKVSIPPECASLIDPQYAQAPYAHLSRQAQWDTAFQQRALARKNEEMGSESRLRRRQTVEKERRALFDRDQKREEERSLRERRALRHNLVRKMKGDMREASTRRLVELVRQEVHDREQALLAPPDPAEREDASKTVSRRRLTVAFSKRLTLRKIPTPPDPGARAEIDGIATVLDRDLADLADDEAAKARLTDFLSPSRKQDFHAWTELQLAALEKALDAKVDKHAAQKLRSFRKKARDEKERRAAFDEDTKSLEAAQLAESESFAAETVRMEYAEMKLRRLEQLAFATVERQRKQFLDITTACFHRDPLRRLEWIETLREFDKNNRSVFKVRDEGSGSAEVLVRVPLGSSEEDALQVREALERFREVGTRTLLSKAQREDDRLPTFSKNLVQIRWSFIHRQRMNWEAYVLTEFCAGQRLSDLLTRMYHEPAQPQTVPEPVVLRIAEQMSHGLRALHLHGLAHLGLEPACIFFTANKELKIGIPRDVRSLQRQSRYKARLAAATSHYASPELVRIVADASTDFDPVKADVWSLGAIVYRLGTGKLLPASFQVAKLVGQPSVRQRSRWFRDLLRMSLQARPSDRATMTDIADFFADVADHVELASSEALNRPLAPMNAGAGPPMLSGLTPAS